MKIRFHSHGNEFDLHVNEISFSYERWAPRLALGKRLKVIRKWPIGRRKEIRKLTFRALARRSDYTSIKRGSCFPCAGIALLANRSSN